MKKSFLLCLIVLCSALPAFSVPTVTRTLKDGYHSGEGGEFTMTPSSELSWVLNYYDSSARGDNDFQSFCMELNEFIYNDTYYAVINDRAIDGGVGPAGDPLSIGTAWLYHEFQNGTLEDYDYDPLGDRATSAGELQDTIWWLEGEIPDDPGNIFSTMVVNKFGSAANAMADNNGYYPVAILNLTSMTGEQAQDVLVCIPAPGAIILTSIGACFAGWLKRKRTL